jgi:hypothetical protein
MYAEYQQVLLMLMSLDLIQTAREGRPAASRSMHASERPSLACLTTSGGERVERKRWTPLSLC